MPELPDIELYACRIRERIIGASVESIGIYNPFVLRSTAPDPADFVGASVTDVGRLGKRIVLEFNQDRFLVIHLMIAGRLQWQSPFPPPKRPLGKVQLAAIRFIGPNDQSGQLTLVETSTRKRASIHLITGRTALDAHRRSGLNLFSCEVDDFGKRLKSRNRTLKRALADPDSFDGIGNAYSDEILFAARLSPVRLTSALSEEEVARLLVAARNTLGVWAERLREEIPGFPKPAQVTAFRPDFAVHGRFGEPCRTCSTPVQRIVYAENETNYCARCQNEGRLLADRSLSRLLKSDWPKTVEEMEGR